MINYISCPQLSLAQSLELNEFTYPRIQGYWKFHAQQGDLVAVKAMDDNNCIGLILAEVMTHPTTGKKAADMRSLWVAPSYRQQGIGSQLFQQLESLCQTLKCYRLHLQYKSTELTQQALEPLLNSQRWQPPTVDYMLFKSHQDSIRNAPWLTNYPLPSQFTTFPWAQLTETDKIQLQTNPTYPQGLAPTFTDDFEPLTSLGLRYQDRVVGWSISHRMAPDTIRYTTMYVEPQFQRMGRGVSLFVESMQRQIGTPIPYGALGVASNNAPMMKFAQRYIRPYMSHVSESRVSAKETPRQPLISSQGKGFATIGLGR